MPRIESTAIPGLLVVHLDVHGDERGWFKENWQRAKMVAHGLPDFAPVQQNISFNGATGVTRGIHAEPWDKFVSVATGRVFGAWVDLRDQDSFGTVHTQEIGPDTAVFVPRGVGNGFQVLADATAYTYLVNDHWRPDAGYTEVNLADETTAIGWPIPLTDPRVVLSEKDRTNPRLADVARMPAPKTLVIGRGQLGTALAEEFTDAELITRAELDLADPAAVADFDFSGYAVVLNAAAYTAVDASETEPGRTLAWSTNAAGPAALAAASREHGFTLVHYSSDYVFDGTRGEHTEDEPLSPLGVYGQSKAAGDLAVLGGPRSYVLRTSWVIGTGHNFVKTMERLARDGVSPGVVSDQIGRLTFTDELARATRHLLESAAPYGLYHLTNGGEPGSWADIAARVFAERGRDAGDVGRVSTVEYAAGKALAPRPLDSTMSLARIRACGFEPRDQWQRLAEYLNTESTAEPDSGS